MTDKLEPAGRLVGQKLSGGKAPLPDLAEGRAFGLFQRIADGAPVVPKGYWGANSDPTAGRGKRPNARPSKAVPEGQSEGHGKRYEHAQQCAVAEAKPRRKGKGGKEVFAEN